MKSLLFYVFSFILGGAAVAAGPIHGPICSWHLDPTSTMTIQWIERVNVPVPANQWYEGLAGFGYGDGDDATTLEMQDHFQRLYVRREFEVKDLPKEPEVNVTGIWKSKAQLGPVPYSFTLDLQADGAKVTGTSTPDGGGDSVPIRAAYVSGKSLYMAIDLQLGSVKYVIDVLAREKEDGKFEGSWSAKDPKGDEAAKGDLTIVRESAAVDLPEKKSDAKEVFNPEAFEMIMKIRYDDAFIAYLNGHEILRKGIKAGEGKNAKEITSHDADATKDEPFVIAKEFNRYLKEGKNILAIEGHNAAIDSSDFTLDPKFTVKVGNDERKLIDAGATWQFFLGDPADAWKTTLAESVSPPLPAESITPFEVHYGERGGALNRVAKADYRGFADTRQVIHSVVLKGLKPNTAYGFSLHENPQAAPLNQQKWFFKTAPVSAEAPITFVTGGDMFHKREYLDDMNRQCAKQNPLFALLGGDLAYANGKEANRWYDWVDSWAQWCVTEDDYLIPMVVVIGNHECDLNLNEVKKDEQKSYVPEKHAKFFYSLFPLPDGKPYYALDFSDYLSLIVLDSYHTYSPEAQTPWLESALRGRREVPNLFACYHRPTYGTLVKEDEMEVRKHWTPLFEQFGVDVAFENDHHVYKRSHPIKQGQVSQDGVLYLGDGAWGIDLRDIPWDKTNALDYIAVASKVHFLYRVTVGGGSQRFDAIDSKGNRFDSYIRFTD